MTDGRAIPEFFRSWRQDWIPPGPWAPLDYLNQDEARRAVLMAQWLFCPEFVEHRAGIYLTQRFNSAFVTTGSDDPT